MALMRTESGQREFSVDQAIMDYVPARVCDAETWVVIAPSVRQAVQSQNLTKRDTVFHWMAYTTRYFAWCHRYGHPLEIQPYLIDAFCDQLELVPSTVQMHRTRLRRIGQSLGTIEIPNRTEFTPHLHTGEEPYSPAELNYLWQIAQSQKTAHRSRLLSSVIALGAGAGLVTREIANLPVNAVQAHLDHPDLLLVHLPDRVTVVDVEWRERVLELCARTSGELWFGNERAQTKDLLSYVKSKAVIPADAPALTIRRLRTTYGVSLLNRHLSPAEFLAIFGSKSAISFERLARFVTPRWDDAEYLRIAAGLA